MPKKGATTKRNRARIIKSSKLLHQKSFPWHLTFDKRWVEKTTPGKPSLCNFHKYLPCCFRKCLNSDDSLIDSSSETEETTFQNSWPLTAINLWNIRSAKAYKKYKNEFTKNQFSNFEFAHLCSIGKSFRQLHRTARITASICKEVFCTDRTQITNKTLFKKIMQYTKRNPTKQMQYGSATESAARDCYVAMQKQEHVIWVLEKLLFMSELISHF